QDIRTGDVQETKEEMRLGIHMTREIERPDWESFRRYYCLTTRITVRDSSLVALWMPDPGSGEPVLLVEQVWMYCMESLWTSAVFGLTSNSQDTVLPPYGELFVAHSGSHFSRDSHWCRTRPRKGLRQMASLQGAIVEGCGRRRGAAPYPSPLDASRVSRGFLVSAPRLSF
ncbi:hypothetical protein CLAIMM_14892, partial [Cladophialophora immunda]